MIYEKKSFRFISLHVKRINLRNRSLGRVPENINHRYKRISLEEIAVSRTLTIPSKHKKNAKYGTILALAGFN